VAARALTFCSVLGQGACPLTFLAGDLDAAERYCTLLVEHTERHPIRLWNLWARAFRGVVTAKRGDIPAGLEIMRKELERAGEARFLPRFLLPLGELAACLGAVGDVAQGLATVDEALVRCEARDERWYEAELLRIKGELRLHAGERRSVSEAEWHFDRAMEVARQQGAVFWELRTAVSLARLRISQDRGADALGILQSVCGRFTEGFAIADMRSAQAMIAQLAPR
jgi:predicted ATPase